MKIRKLTKIGYATGGGILYVRQRDNMVRVETSKGHAFEWLDVNTQRDALLTLCTAHAARQTPPRARGYEINTYNLRQAGNKFDPAH